MRISEVEQRLIKRIASRFGRRARQGESPNMGMRQGFSVRGRLLCTRVSSALEVGVIVALLVIAGLYAASALDDEGLQDYGSFIASGSAAVEGRNPYGEDEPLVLVQPVAGSDPVRNPNLNPPISVLGFSALARFDPTKGLMWWRVATLLMHLAAIALAAASARMRIPKPRFAWALAVFCLWETVRWGQVYAIVEVLVALALLGLLRKRPTTAGAAIGLAVAIKPNLALWLLALLAARQYRAFISAALAFLVAWAIPLAVYGAEIYLQWIDAARSYAGALRNANGSIPSLMAFLGASRLMSYGIAGTLTAGTLVLVWRRPGNLDLANETGLALSILAAPVAWAGYSILLVPSLLTRSWDRATRVAIVLLLFPWAIPLWPAGWPLLILLIRSLWVLARGASQTQAATSRAEPE